MDGELSSDRVGWTGAQRPVHPTRILRRRSSLPRVGLTGSWAATGWGGWERSPFTPQESSAAAVTAQGGVDGERSDPKFSVWGDQEEEGNARRTFAKSGLTVELDTAGSPARRRRRTQHTSIDPSKPIVVAKFCSNKKK